MAVYEGASPQLVQGVSQQIPRDRLPGQVESLVNMVCDATTGPRRRPGVQYRANLFVDPESAWDPDTWFFGYTDLGGERMRIVVDTSVGRVTLLDEDYNEAFTDVLSYLVAPSAEHIQVAVVSDELIIANTSVRPTGGSTIASTSNKGYAYVSQGAFSKKYELTLTLGEDSFTVAYTTPSGSTPGDADLATPQYIAEQLLEEIQTYPSRPFEVSVWREESTLFFVCGYVGPRPTLVVTSSSGSVYMQTSQASQIGLVSSLPANMPEQADVDHSGLGYRIAVGQGTALVWYAWSAAKRVWLEVAGPGQYSVLNDMPIRFTRDNTGTIWMNQTFPGAQAGDGETNPEPYFLRYGITGLASYQGRLVVLAGPFVSMSSSVDPTKFYRTTVASLVDTDAIHVGSSGNISSPYLHAVPFQKDLLLFSDRYQAVVPSGNTAITPRTAMVVLTSDYIVDPGAKPIGLGRTLMYTVPRNTTHFGMLEMVPSTYTDAQYTSHDTTNHLPRFFEGRARWSASSTMSNLAVFGGTQDPTKVYVHEYMWGGDDKIQQAWHEWRLPYPVGACAFAGGQLEFLLLGPTNTLLVVSLDARQRSFPGEAERVPFLDCWVKTDVEDHVVQDLPIWMQYTAVLPTLQMEQGTGSLAGEAIGGVVQAGTLRTVRSYPDGPVYVGVPYESSITPTPPQVHDREGRVRTVDKGTLLRYMVSTLNTSEYTATILRHPTQPTGSIRWSSRDLQPGTPRTGDGAKRATVPARTLMDQAYLTLTSVGSGDLNVVGLEYTIRYNQRRGRF